MLLNHLIAKKKSSPVIIIIPLNKLYSARNYNSQLFSKRL